MSNLIEERDKDTFDASYVPVNEISARLWKYPVVLLGYMMPVTTIKEVEDFLTALFSPIKPLPQSSIDSIANQVQTVIAKIREFSEDPKVVPKFISLSMLEDMVLIDFPLEAIYTKTEKGYEVTEPWFAYVYNVTVDYFSEYGYMSVEWNERAKLFRRIG